MIKSSELVVSGSFFDIVIFLIESNSVNKNNIIITLFGPSERRKYVFCGLKSAPGVNKTPGARVFALVLRYLRNQYLYRNIII